MIERNQLRFNCCESVLIRIDTRHKLPGFGPEVMRVASNFGGGVTWGSVCGAVSGAAMAIGLLMGTNGDESPEVYKQKRDAKTQFTREFMQAFEDKYGHVNCYELLGANTRTPEGKKLIEERKARGEVKCEEYVEWAAEKVIELLEENGF